MPLMKSRTVVTCGPWIVLQSTELMLRSIDIMLAPRSRAHCSAAALPNQQILAMKGFSCHGRKAGLSGAMLGPLVLVALPFKLLGAANFSWQPHAAATPITLLLPSHELSIAVVAFGPWIPLPPHSRSKSRSRLSPGTAGWRGCEGFTGDLVGRG